MVSSDDALEKLTVPGPDTLLQIRVRVLLGRPSSTLVPFKATVLFGRVIEAPLPASTPGALLLEAVNHLAVKVFSTDATCDEVRGSS